MQLFIFFSLLNILAATTTASQVQHDQDDIQDIAVFVADETEGMYGQLTMLQFLSSSYIDGESDHPATFDFISQNTDSDSSTLSSDSLTIDEVVMFVQLQL